MSAQRERVAVLGEVRELIEQRRQDWALLDDVAEQALRALGEEIDALIEASQNAWRSGGHNK